MIGLLKRLSSRLYKAIDAGEEESMYLYKMRDYHGNDRVIDLRTVQDFNDAMRCYGVKSDESKLKDKKVFHPRLGKQYANFFKRVALPESEEFYIQEEVIKGADDVASAEGGRPTLKTVPEKDHAGDRIKELDKFIDELKVDADWDSKRCMIAFRAIAQDNGSRLKNKRLEKFTYLKEYTREEGAVKKAIKDWFGFLKIPATALIFYLTYEGVSKIIPQDVYNASIVVPFVAGATTFLSVYLPYWYEKAKNKEIERRNKMLEVQEKIIFIQTWVQTALEYSAAIPGFLTPLEPEDALTGEIPK